MLRGRRVVVGSGNGGRSGHRSGVANIGDGLLIIRAVIHLLRLG